MRRIEPEQVIEAYKKTGLTPRQGMYFSKANGENCACALGVIYAAELMDRIVDIPFDIVLDELSGDAATQGRISELYDATYSADYCAAFTAAFDGGENEVDLLMSFSPKITINKEEYDAGHEDGKAAYEALRRARKESNVFSDTVQSEH